jgi:hypothetical protein
MEQQQMKSSHDKEQTNDESAAAGAAVYSKPILSIYDLFVLGFSNTFAWKSPSRLMVDFYNEHVSGNHLDVGVGTGYFLDKCTFPSSTPTIALMDLNPNSLRAASQRLSRYNPAIYVANILEPPDTELAGFDSIGLNYLLHCLPGTIPSKGVVFSNLMPFLNSGGVVFGTTILGQGVERNIIAKRIMKIYNWRGIFSNTQDNPADLENILKENYNDYSIRIEGCVAFFVGRN